MSGRGRYVFVVTTVFALTVFGWATVCHTQLDRLRKPKALEPTMLPETPMVDISEGIFSMGFDGIQALEDERPLHRVWLDAFAMDLYEVTTTQYALFLGATNRPALVDRKSVV